MRFVSYVSMLLLFAAVALAGDHAADPSDPIARALSERSEKDRAKDARRHPLTILAFAGIEPGMTVADLMAGGGWYTEVLARAVGSEGKVYAHNSPLTQDRYGKRFRRRLDASGLSNIDPIVSELAELPFEPDSLDAVFLVLFYHDTYWMGLDRAAVNRAVYSALKPGGVFLVVDHAAVEGEGARVTKTLHRVEEALAREEILAAGFELAATTDALRNPKDDRRKSVFKRKIQGRTDRFALKFVKPE